MSDGITITVARYQLADSALQEITEISVALRDLIAKLDTCGQVQPVARGMLSRVEKLSEAVSECIGEEPAREGDDERLFRQIHCRKPRANEMAGFSPEGAKNG